jgi:transposase-like protein
MGDIAPLIATVIADAARRIESEAFRAAFPDCRIVVTPAHGSRGSALLAVDRYDLVIGATRTARQTLGLTANNLVRPLTNSRQMSDLRAAERAELLRALARTDGNMSAAARDLGIGRATLYRRLKRLGLPDGPETATHAVASGQIPQETVLLSHIRDRSHLAAGPTVVTRGACARKLRSKPAWLSLTSIPRPETTAKRRAHLRCLANLRRTP